MQAGKFWTAAIENTDNTACRNIRLLVDATVSLERLVTQTRKEEKNKFLHLEMLNSPLLATYRAPLAHVRLLPNFLVRSEPSQADAVVQR
jgi:hypothetical protein